jgi:hypothetical protein
MRVIAAAAFSLAIGAPMWAQCAMCRTVAAAQGQAAARTLDQAILILIFPAMALFCGLFLLMFRSRPLANPAESKDDCS